MGLVSRLRLTSEAAYTDLEEVEIAPKLATWCVIALEGSLAYHNNDEAYQRCEREQHRREDTRKTPDFAHLCRGRNALSSICVDSWVLSNQAVVATVTARKR